MLANHPETIYVVWSQALQRELMRFKIGLHPLHAGDWLELPSGAKALIDSVLHDPIHHRIWLYVKTPI